MKRMLLAFALIAFLLPTGAALAQADDEPDVWVLTYYKVPPSRLDACLSAWDKHFGAIDAVLMEQGLVLDVINMTHLYADEWNVVQLRKYPSFGDIDAAGDAFGDARRAVWSDEETATFQEENAGCTPDFHRDMIYTDYQPAADDGDGDGDGDDM